MESLSTNSLVYSVCPSVVFLNVTHLAVCTSPMLKPFFCEFNTAFCILLWLFLSMSLGDTHSYICWMYSQEKDLGIGMHASLCSIWPVFQRSSANLLAAGSEHPRCSCPFLDLASSSLPFLTVLLMSQKKMYPFPITVGSFGLGIAFSFCCHGNLIRTEL